MTKLSDFIAPMNRYHNYINRNNIEVMITDVLDDYKMIDQSVYEYFSLLFSLKYENYSHLGYRVIPMELTDNAENDAFTLLRAMCNYAMTMGELIKLFKKIDNQIKVANLDIYESENVTSSSTLHSTNTNEKHYGKKIEKDNSVTEKTVGERAPINSDINTIDTPDVKGHASTTSHTEDNHSGTDNDNTKIDSTDNGNVSRKRISPEVFDDYIEVVQRVNLHNIIDDIICNFIWEFNAVR